MVAMESLQKCKLLCDRCDFTLIKQDSRHILRKVSKLVTACRSTTPQQPEMIGSEVGNDELYSEMKTPPINPRPGGEKFALSECPAYGPVCTTQGPREQGDTEYEVI